MNPEHDSKQSTVAWNSTGDLYNGGNKSTVKTGDYIFIQAAYTLKIIYLMIGLFGFFSNIFVVVVISLYTPMHKQLTNFFILNQSVMDTIVAFFLFFTTLYEDDGRAKTAGDLADEALCRVWYTKLPLWGMLLASTYGIMSVTLERFFAVVYPIWHKTTFTRTRTLSTVAMAFPWFFGPGFQLSYMIATAGITAKGECTVYSVYPDKRTQAAVGILNIFVQYMFPLLFLGYCYSRMAWVLHKRVETAEGPSGGTTKEAKRNESMARARSNVIKTLALVALSFMVCWTWNQIYYLLYQVGFSWLDFTSTFYNFTVIMVFANCCVNPVIYSVKYEPFQRGVSSIFCRNKVRPSEDHAHGSNSTCVHQDGTH